jgi:hypothetical protein
MINDWLDDLQAQPPAVIVDSEAAHQYWDATDDFLRPPPPGYAGGRTLDLLEPFRVFVAAHYELSAEIAGRKIYVLLEQPQGDT